MRINKSSKLALIILIVYYILGSIFHGSLDVTEWSDRSRIFFIISAVCLIFLFFLMSIIRDKD